MTSINIGDEVRLFRSRRRRGPVVPEGGYRGTVTKVGRRWASAEFEQTWTDSQGKEQQIRSEISFDLETGIVRADTEGLYVRTPEQLDRDERRKMAVFVLGERGIEVKLGYGNSLTLEQLEALAEVTQTWDQGS